MIGHEGQPYVKVRVQGQKLLSLVDTGASKSVINERIISELNMWDYVKETDVTLMAMGEHPIRTLGTIMLMVEFPNSIFRANVEFQVVKEFPQDCILGWDFLTSGSLSVESRRGKFILKRCEDLEEPIICKETNSQGKIAMMVSRRISTDEQEGLVRPESRDLSTDTEREEKYKEYLCPAEAVQIPAYGEHHFMMKVPNRTWDFWGQEAIQVLPLDEMPEGCLVVAKQLVMLSKKLIPLRVINLSQTPVRIKENSRFARIEELHNEETQVLGWDSWTGLSRPLSVYCITVVTPDNAEKIVEETLRVHPWIKELNIGDLSVYQKAEVYQRLAKYSKVFSKGDMDIGNTHLIQAKIPLDTDQPIRTRPYPMSMDKLAQLKVEVQKLKDLGVVEKSISSYNSPTVLVKKKDGSCRLCIDFRKINEHTLPQDWPLPTFDMATKLLAHNQFFSGLDMVAGYYQIPLHPDSRDCTTFTAGVEKVRFTRLPMGCRNSVAEYQRLMTVLLGEMQFTKALVYIDDILIWGATFEEHLDRLTEVWEKLEGANLKLKTSKCGLFQKQVKFLGHVIGSFGIRPDNKKVEAIEKFGRPKHAKDIKSFLGIANYFRRFVPNYSLIAKPLYDLTSEKIKFKWGEEQQLAFIRLKNALCLPPILAHPNFEKPFTLYTDASLIGVGGILCQEHPEGGEMAIAYASRKLTDAQTRYTITELELWALVYAIKQFRCYLHGVKFVAVVDHCPLKHLRSMRDPTARHFRWIWFLMDFQFEIRHRRGTAHGSVDALSRDPNFADRSILFQNPRACLLKGGPVKGEDVDSWLDNVTSQLEVSRSSKAPELLTYEENHADSLFEAMSMFLTGTTASAGRCRDLIHMYESHNRRYVELNNIKCEEGVSTYLKSLKRGAAGTLMEVQSIASLLKVPVIYRIGQGANLMMGEMESKLIGEPPEGVVFEIEQDEWGNWRWVNFNYLAGKNEHDEKVWTKEKRARVNFDKEIENLKKEALGQRGDSAFGELEPIFEEKEEESDDSDEEGLFPMCSLQVRMRNMPTKEDELYVPTAGEIRKCQNKDAFCSAWIKYLKQGDKSGLSKRLYNRLRECLVMNDQDMLVYRPRGRTRREEPAIDKLVLPQMLFPTVIKGIHNFLAHPGRDKTLQLINQRYYRPGMADLVACFIKACDLCKNKTTVKTSHLHELQRFPVAQARFVAWNCDYMGPLKTTERGNKFIFTAVDQYSRWLEAVALPDAGSELLAHTMMDTIVARYGVPKLIHSDRGSDFLSNLMNSFYKVLKIKKTHTSPWHPQANGKIERIHSYLGNALRVTSDVGQTDWDLQLPYALLSYRTSFHKYTGDAPAYVVYGVDLDLPVYSMMETDMPRTFAMGLTPSGTGTEVAHRLALARRRHEEVAEKQTAKSHEDANRTREPVTLKVGDVVLFKRPLTKKGLSKKLHRPWVGPFRIIRKIGEATFVVKVVGGRRQYQCHADSLLKSDEGFRQEMEGWASQAREVMEDLDELTNVTPPVMKTVAGEGLRDDQLEPDDSEQTERQLAGTADIESGMDQDIAQAKEAEEDAQRLGARSKVKKTPTVKEHNTRSQAKKRGYVIGGRFVSDEELALPKPLT